ncbi:cytoplasmic protein [Coprinopsis cinerea okayama7|uniref:Cytoplasmic protein n=1 Tax=Coprinopsis cinerea (strain Okayama-7 / 130 / ATCC MYA-4618 / FGSC 9003) TaxID=240176 RepID=D6RP29_COPC7|nr:cytoplasmic protein [Coprinopsis cinerea okayama7\|eukprot:XP_002910710.1 cytoplasmic protein [Coprinopsis cinerea okayama7\
MASNKPIVGSIVERKPSSKPTGQKPGFGGGPSGFPSVQHRSKSAFARNREEAQRRNAAGGVNGRPTGPPTVTASTSSSTASSTAGPTPSTKPQPSPSGFSLANDHAPPKDDIAIMREHISQENEKIIAGMSPEEIEEERRQIIARFGTGIGGVLEKAKKNRMKREQETKFVGSSHRRGALPPLPPETPEELRELSEVPITPEGPKPTERARSPPPPALSAASSRPSSRADRRLRFAELEPKDVYVYESSPPTPKKPVLALPPPSDKRDPTVVSLGKWHGNMAYPPQPMAVPDSSEPKKEHAPNNTEEKEPEEGTPEYIRRRYFPQVPASDPSIEWMMAKSDDSTNDSSIRFDLQGAPIPPDLRSKLPTHLGLHHHAEGSHAGYTLDDIFLLSRSTVPAQRAAMFTVISGICERLCKMAHGQSVPGLEELKGKEEELRKRIAAAGVEAMNEKGSVGLQAIEVVWRSVADWDKELVAVGLDGVQLEASADETIQSLPLDFILPSISTAFNLYGEAYPPATLKQLLQVVQRLALQNTNTATKIVETDKLVLGIGRCFLLSPTLSDRGSVPDPSAINLLTSLVRTSRQAAETISKALADDLLRFIVSLPTSSMLKPSLATALVASTLDFYAALGMYGLYTCVASTAMEQFNNLSRYILSLEPESSPLLGPWLNLTQVWTICAIEPHNTSPPHDILWSRVSAWGWQMDIMQMMDKLELETVDRWKVWGDLLGTLAAWMEGAKVNGVRGGETERSELLAVVKPAFVSGSGEQWTLVNKCIDYLQSALSQPSPSIADSRTSAGVARVLSNAIRLWLSCLPPRLEGPPEAPPFDLPFARISTLVASLLTNPMWTAATSALDDRERRYAIVYLRDFASLSGWYLRLSRRLPDTSQGLWLAQAFSIVLRCLPGDEEFTLNTIDSILSLIPEINPAILEPFMEDAVLPREKVETGDEDDQAVEVVESRPRLSPITPTPTSITTSTVLVMPSPFIKHHSNKKLSGLPLQTDWMLGPLNDLIHSGESPVFRHLPRGWDFSELDVTRATLALALKARQILSEWKLFSFVLKRGEAILGCMKVFMLEHGLVQDTQKTSEGEVFRDKIVEELMVKLIDPYRVGAPSNLAQLDSGKVEDLEKLASSILGPSTPFYQFYTDFIGLYDAISFSHPMFGLLLLPPISMRYAVDYRRLFWNDYSHTLRTITVYPNQVVAADLREYLYPVENDAQVIGGYLSAVLKRSAKEFLRWVALHHVASNIWVDLRDEKEDGPFNQDRAVKLLQAIVAQGDVDTIAGVVKYKQPPRHEKAKLPQDCGQPEADVLSSRKVWVQKSLGDGYTKKIEGLL